MLDSMRGGEVKQCCFDLQRHKRREKQKSKVKGEKIKNAAGATETD